VALVTTTDRTTHAPFIIIFSSKCVLFGLPSDPLPQALLANTPHTSACITILNPISKPHCVGSSGRSV